MTNEAIARRSIALKSARWGAIIAVSLLLIFAAWVFFSERQEEPGGVVLQPLDGSVLPGGEKVSIVDAMRLFAVPLYRPETPQDSDATITGVWVRNEGSPETYIEYESGLAVTIRPASESLSTRSWAKAQTAEGVPGSVVVVDGVDAFLVSPTSEGDGGSIRFVLNGALVAAIGPRGAQAGEFSPDRLKLLASSIIQSAPAVLTAESTAG